MKNRTKLEIAFFSLAFVLVSVLVVGGCGKEGDSGRAGARPPQNATSAQTGDNGGNDDGKSANQRDLAKDGTVGVKTNAIPFVAGFDPTELRGFELKFSDMPDLNRLMDYVKIVPSPGPVTTDWWDWSKTVAIRGDFAACTTYQVTVKAGLPMADGRKTASEFRRTYTTGNKAPSMDFAARGRARLW